MAAGAGIVRASQPWPDGRRAGPATDAVIVESLAGLRAEVDRLAASLDESERIARGMPHRGRYLLLSHSLARRLLAAPATGSTRWSARWACPSDPARARTPPGGTVCGAVGASRPLPAAGERWRAFGVPFRPHQPGPGAADGNLRGAPPAPRVAGHGRADARGPVAVAHAGGDGRRRGHQPDLLPPAVPAPGRRPQPVDPPDHRRGDALPRLHGRGRAQGDPLAEPLRRPRAPEGGGHRLQAPCLVLAAQDPADRVPRQPGARAAVRDLPLQPLDRQLGLDVVGRHEGVLRRRPARSSSTTR